VSNSFRLLGVLRQTGHLGNLRHDVCDPAGRILSQDCRDELGFPPPSWTAIGDIVEQPHGVAVCDLLWSGIVRAEIREKISELGGDGQLGGDDFR